MARSKSFITTAPATATPNAAVWTLGPTVNGFQWVSPRSAEVLCKFAGVSAVDNANLTRTSQFTKVVPSKYPTWSGWAQAQSNRLKSWGFNAAGQYSYAYGYPGNFPNGGMPVEAVVQVSGHAKRDDISGGVQYYHCKSINNSYGSMVCGTSLYLPSGGGQLDVFDVSCDNGKGTAGAFMADLGRGGNSNSYTPDIGLLPVSDYVFITTEEADDLFGFNNQFTHEDLGYDIAAHDPMVTTSPNNYTYPNKTLDAKVALRDYVASLYGCTKPGGGVGTTQSAGDDVHAAGDYCGSDNATISLRALNIAWGTSYTTWSTSDSVGELGIKNGTYASYGTGTGFLDENGRHIASSSYQANCSLNGGLLPVNPWTTHPQIETDLHHFVGYFAQTYAQELSSAWAQPSANPHPPIFVPLYDGPSYVYTASAPYFDGFWVNPQAGSGTAMRLSDTQRIIAAASAPGGKSMPLIIGDYSSANPDSPFRTSTEGAPRYATQVERGTGMVSFWQSALQQKDASGKYVVVGFEHWAFYDQANEGWNAGLVTSYHDNPYDGSATTANGEAANYGDALTPISKFLNAGICDPGQRQR